MSRSTSSLSSLAVDCEPPGTDRCDISCEAVMLPLHNRQMAGFLMTVHRSEHMLPIMNVYCARTKGVMGGEVEGEGVDIAWPDLQLSLRDSTAAASGPIWS